MRIYGLKKTKTPIACHQDCSICHGPQKNLKKRARRENKKEVQDGNKNAT